MFQITRQTDYGLLLVTALASRHREGYVSLREITESRGMPYRFLMKISIPLRKAGIIDSREGAHGGYRLAKAPDQIKVREVLEALGERLNFVHCDQKGSSCPSFCQCTMRDFWHDVQSQIDEVVSSYTIADLSEKGTPIKRPNVTFITS